MYLGENIKVTINDKEYEAEMSGDESLLLITGNEKENKNKNFYLRHWVTQCQLLIKNDACKNLNFHSNLYNGTLMNSVVRKTNKNYYIIFDYWIDNRNR
jgi:hypothetical protein